MLKFMWLDERVLAELSEVPLSEEESEPEFLL
jgi:hypothetical protein